MIHIDKLQLGHIVQKWDKLAKNWDKFDMGQIDQTPIRQQHKGINNIKSQFLRQELP